MYVHMQLLRNVPKQQASGSNRQLFQGNNFLKSVFPLFAFIIFTIKQKVLTQQTKNCMRWKARIYSFPVHTLFDLQLYYFLFNHNNREDKSYIAEPKLTLILDGADYWGNGQNSVTNSLFDKPLLTQFLSDFEKLGALYTNLFSEIKFSQMIKEKKWSVKKKN